MRHSFVYRLLTAFFGMWFTFTLVQPNGMSGMMMNSAATNGSGAPLNSGNSGSVMSSMTNMTSNEMTSMHHAAVPAIALDAHGAPVSAEPGTQGKPTTPPECEQHDCCCSALSPISLMPSAALSWLPEHVIGQEPLCCGNCVVHTDGQLLLPFANGPPRTVRA